MQWLILHVYKSLGATLDVDQLRDHDKQKRKQMDMLANYIIKSVYPNKQGMG